jgi:hypothetical protein
VTNLTKKVRISEIEINFCNACSARCYLCAQAHGRGNRPLMSGEVFDALVGQLGEIDFDVIQTSGNGDCWLHPEFFHWLRILRAKFPRATIVNYSSFLLYTPDRADGVVRERLLDRQHTRIDSLDAEIFSRSANLDARQVFAHLDYFLAQKSGIPLHIGYSSIAGYYRKCRKLLGHPPFHGPFAEEMALELPDELDAIRARFPGAIVEPIRHSLWAEREDPRTPPDVHGSCPKAGLLDRIVWVCPDGSLDACGYDDTQRQFVYGNILDAPLAELWRGARRQEMLARLLARQVEHYPCNPRCCRMYLDSEESRVEGPEGSQR